MNSVINETVHVRMEAQRQEPIDQPFSLPNVERGLSRQWLAYEIDRAVGMVEGRFVR